MPEIRVEVHLPEPAPEVSQGALKSMAAAVGEAGRAMATRHPEYQIWNIEVNYRNGVFDIVDLTGQLRKGLVKSIRGAGKNLSAGTAVLVGFYDRDPDRPFIVGPAHVSGSDSNRELTFWTQSAATHLQNSCSPDRCRAFPLGAPGSILYSYFSRSGAGHDSRARVFGLVAFKDRAKKSRLGLAYPVFTAGGDRLECYKIEVLTMTGDLVETFEFASVATAPLGNWSSFGQFFIDPASLHFVLAPFSTAEQVCLRAWTGANGPRMSTTPVDRQNLFVSSAFQRLLYAAFTMDYTWGHAPNIGAYWPLTLTAPFTATAAAKLQGFTRTDEGESSLQWSRSPLDLVAAGDRVVSGCFGHLGGWPASPDGSSWTVAISERELFDPSVPEAAALLYGYKTKIHNSIVEFAVTSFARRLQLHVHELSADTGKPLWTHTIAVDPSVPIADDALLTPMENYILSPFGTGLIPADRVEYNYATDPPTAHTFSTRAGGRVSEGGLPSDAEWIEGHPEYLLPNVYPGRIRDPYSSYGALFQWPTFLYFQGPIVLFPRAQGNDVRPVGAFSGSSSFYDGNKNNFRCLTEFLLREDSCGPGLRRDPDGNIYFCYARPFPFLIGGQVVSLDSVLPGETRTTHYHKPQLVWGGETFQVSLTAKRAVRWVRDLTTRSPGCSWWNTSHVFGELSDTVIGGTASTALPVVGNVWEPGLPIGRFVFTVREVRFDINFRPDNYLDIAEAGDGNNVVNTVYLTNYGGSDAFDTLSADVPDPDNPGSTLASAGERVWYSQSVKIKGAVDDAGIEWVLIYMEQLKRDRTVFKRQLLTLQAPTDKSIGQWSDIGLWEPGPGEGPDAADFDSLVLFDGGYCWNHWDGVAQRIYSRTL